VTAVITPIASSHERPTPPPRRWRWVWRGILTVTFATALALCTWGVWRWATYPQPPDVATADLDAMFDFIGSDEFNRMFEQHRLDYMSAVVDRLGQASFKDYLALMMRGSDQRAQITANVRSVKGYDQLGSKLFALFLEKYYAQSPAERKATLILLAYAQETYIARSPEEFDLPSIEEFKRDASRFMSRQPPRVQAMCSQFLLDLKAQRDALGLKDPF
jgi:hypothetical protein